MRDFLASCSNCQYLVEAGIIPALHKVVERNSKEREIAMPIFFEIVKAGPTARLALLQTNSLPYYLQLIQGTRFVLPFPMGPA